MAVIVLAVIALASLTTCAHGLWAQPPTPATGSQIHPQCTAPAPFPVHCFLSSGAQGEYFYEVGKDLCEPIPNHMCGIGYNRFTNKKKCQETCHVHMPARCKVFAPLFAHCGKPQGHKYTYNHATKQCRAIFTAKCGTKPNIYDTLEECQQVCLIRDTDCQKTIEHGTINAAQPSHESQTRYGFTHGMCVSFTYHGSGGNGNNFVTKHDCDLKCPGHHSLPWQVHKAYAPENRADEDQDQDSDFELINSDDTERRSPVPYTRRRFQQASDDAEKRSPETYYKNWGLSASDDVEKRSPTELWGRRRRRGH